jgi:hypothetical protein
MRKYTNYKHKHKYKYKYKYNTLFVIIYGIDIDSLCSLFFYGLYSISSFMLNTDRQLNNINRNLEQLIERT